MREQIRIAMGEPLSPMSRRDTTAHAIECRINAEDPANNFQPTPGRIDFYYAPGGRGVRIDSHVYTGYSVPPYYDSLIAKIITIGSTRINAIDRIPTCSGRVIHQRNQNDCALSCGHDAKRRFSRRKLRHRFDRPPHFSGQAQLEHAAPSFA